MPREQVRLSTCYSCRAGLPARENRLRLMRIPLVRLIAHYRLASRMVFDACSSLQVDVSIVPSHGFRLLHILYWVVDVKLM